MTIDANGDLWIANYNGAQVNVLICLVFKIFFFTNFQTNGLGAACEWNQCKVVGQVEDSRRKGFICHVWRTSVGQTVRNDNKSWSVTRKIQ